MKKYRLAARSFASGLRASLGMIDATGESVSRPLRTPRTARLVLGALGVATLVACSAAPRTGSGNGDDGVSGDNSGTFGTGDDQKSSGGPNKPCSGSPGNYDIPGNNCDDDGDGKIDNPPTCDSAAGSGSAEDFARAIGICANAAKDGYGLVSAKFTRGYKRTDAPNAAQHGVLPKFGNVVKPREGGMLGVLSTGYAREYNGSDGTAFGIGNGFDDGGMDWFSARPSQGNGSAPPGFPKPATGCQQDNKVNDVIDVVLELKAPKNANAFAFDFDFYSSEWPAYICTKFNDGFVAYLSAQGFNGGKPDNMSFDKNQNPVSVNNGFFDRCTPNARIGCDGPVQGTSQCPGGTAELEGTGYGMVGQWCRPFDGSNGRSVNGGATGWLSSQASVNGGETFTLELMIWDTGDGVLDSSVLIDNFRWLGDKVTTDTSRPPS